MRCFIWLAVAWGVCVAALEAADGGRALSVSGVKGGLVVRIGCDDPEALRALHGGAGYVVQGLDTDAARVDRARAAMADSGRYGVVSVDTWDGVHLPYIDNLVNLLVADDAAGLATGEVDRVLVPGGVALLGGERYVKARPAAIDDWNHYLHDPGNNAVAHDSVVGPPRHVQWTGGPRWARHHDHVASMNAMVSESGRLFYIMDEGATASALTPSKWRLIARDAFNGIVLWKRTIPDWVPALWPLKSGPASLPRRLVAIDDTVYAPLGFSAPVSALAADSGVTRRSYEGSDNTEEIIVCGDRLLALTITKPIILSHPGPGNLVEADPKQIRDGRITKAPLITFYWNQAQSHRWFDSERVIKAYAAGTGELLWASAPSKVMPLSMAADEKRVYYHDGEAVVALDAATGQPLYRTEPVPVSTDRLFAFFGPTLVVCDGVIVFAGGEKIGLAWMGWERKDQGEDSMTAFDAGTGRKLWSAPHPYGGYQSPEDVLIADGLVWAADTAIGSRPGSWIGRGLHSGAVEREVPPTLKTGWFHHRCYRAKATDRFMIPSRNGIEFIDIIDRTWDINHWVRSGCLYGVMPANGLVYTSPHDCACHPQAKLCGFNALAAEHESAPLPEPADRLQKGPAFGSIPPTTPASPDDWPMYRRTELRCGSSPVRLPAAMTAAWTCELAPAKLSQAVVAGGLLVTASADTHTVFALDAATGSPRWTYVAGGRVDSPPTLYEGMVVFGSADGYVTCLRAADGALVWRFLAAPADRRLTAFGQLESVWPVHGSVLVKDGEAFFTAGRSFFLDGGVRFYRVKAATGEVLSQTLFDKQDYSRDAELQASGGLDMPVALPDILSADGDTLFMRSQVMDKDGRRTTDLRDHLFAPYGFVDDAWFHRAYWVFGKNYFGGCGGYPKAGKLFPSGRMIVHDDEDVYVFGRRPTYFRWITEMDYRLFCSRRPPPEDADDATAKRPGAKKNRPRQAQAASATQLRWSREIPVLVRAMGKAAETLYIAGPPCLVDEAKVVLRLPAADAVASLEAQDAAYRGEKGALLCAVSVADGTTQAEYTLSDLPAFDGISIADGRLYIATETGKIICMQ